MLFPKSTGQNERLIETAAAKPPYVKGDGDDTIERRPVDIGENETGQKIGQCRPFYDVASVFKLKDDLMHHTVIGDGGPSQVIKRFRLKTVPAKVIVGR